MARAPTPAALLYQTRASRIRDALSRRAVATFDGLRDWSDADALAVPMAAASTQAQVVQATLLESMVNHLLTRQGADPVAVNLGDVTGDLVRGGDIIGSWRIPMYALWGEMGAGDTDQAGLIEQGRNDVSVQAVTDLSLSQREAMTQMGAQSDAIVGYWRVPAGGSSCEFCNTISDRLYHIENLMPVHPNCVCGVEPAFASDASEADFSAGE